MDMHHLHSNARFFLPFNSIKWRRAASPSASMRMKGGRRPRSDLHEAAEWLLQLKRQPPETQKARKPCAPEVYLPRKTAEGPPGEVQQTPCASPPPHPPIPHYCMRSGIASWSTRATKAPIEKVHKVNKNTNIMKLRQKKILKVGNLHTCGLKGNYTYRLW